MWLGDKDRQAFQAKKHLLQGGRLSSGLCRLCSSSKQCLFECEKWSFCYFFGSHIYLSYKNYSFYFFKPLKVKSNLEMTVPVTRRI